VSTYRAYLRTFDGNVPADTKTVTSDASAALDAFAALVNRTDLDGQKLAAALTINNRQMAFHRFDRAPGDADYWRDKLDTIPLPRAPGRPVEIDARRVNVTLDDGTIEQAKAFGDGNLSAGLREAVRIAREFANGGQP
jgi:hypothetical protein